MQTPVAYKTWRRVFWTAGIALLVIGFAQTIPIEIAFLLAGDTMLYLEVVTAVMLAAARGHVRATLRVTGHAVRTAAQNFSDFVRHRLGARQRRNASAPKRKRPYTGPLSSEDEPVIEWGVSYALA